MSNYRDLLSALSGRDERTNDDDEPETNSRPKFLALVVRPGASGGHLVQFVSPSLVTTGEPDAEEIALNETQLLTHVREFYRHSLEAQRAALA